MWRIGLSVVFMVVGLQMNPAQARSLNGFPLDGALVPSREIARGGPPRDGIPAIDKPQFVSADKARLRPADRVLGLVINGHARAYPIGILNWHEIVNDRVGDTPVVISFCPLCGTGMAFDARVGGKDRTFGVSGLLYNSDVLLYDRQSESLWSQVMSQAVAGPLKGTRLTMRPLSHTTWGDWHTRHPDTRVLSDKTGYFRNYRQDPYAGYGSSRHVMFPVRYEDDRYHPKEPVLGVAIGDHFKAYPFSELARAKGAVKDTVGGTAIQVIYDAAHHTARAVGNDGTETPTVIAFWFAWYAFHPETEVFTAR